MIVRTSTIESVLRRYKQRQEAILYGGGRYSIDERDYAKSELDCVVDALNDLAAVKEALR